MVHQTISTLKRGLKFYDSGNRLGNKRILIKFNLTPDKPGP